MTPRKGILTIPQFSLGSSQQSRNCWIDLDFIDENTKMYMIEMIKKLRTGPLLAERSLAAIVPPLDTPTKVSGPFGDRLMAGRQFLVLAI
jgi:hypothetical protein